MMRVVLCKVRIFENGLIPVYFDFFLIFLCCVVRVWAVSLKKQRIIQRKALSACASHDQKHALSWPLLLHMHVWSKHIVKNYSLE